MHTRLFAWWRTKLAWHDVRVCLLAHMLGMTFILVW
jgi:hypothetical protein